MPNMVGSWHIIDRYLIVCEMKRIRFYKCNVILNQQYVDHISPNYV